MFYSQKLNVDPDHSIYWSEKGQPDSPALLLIHGGSGHVLHNEKMTSLNGLDLHIIQMHQRGVGLSTPYGETRNNTVDTNTQDIEILRQHLGIEAWSVFSWSFGAVFMSNYAFAHPQRCNSLISYAPFLGSQDDYDIIAVKKPDTAEKYFAAQNTKDAHVIADNFYKSATNPDFATRFDGYYQAQRVWNEALLPDVLYQSKTPTEWDKIFKARAISSGMYKELYGVKDRFLQNKADLHGPISAPTTLIYGTEDAWSDFTTYADTLFLNKAVLHVPAGHDVHHINVQNVLHNQFALLQK